MSVRDIIMAAGGASASVEANYIEECFSSYLYTGNGTSQTITNGIDLATKGGLVWIKVRDATYNHILADTVRGIEHLSSNLTVGSNPDTLDVSAYNSDGFSVSSNGRVNFNTRNFSSWTFRRQPKFFDIVTYTGNGVNGRQIAHSLGSIPAMIIVKCTSTTGDWWVYHRSLTAGDYLKLNTTAASTSDPDVFYNTQNSTSTNFYIGNSGNVNTNGNTYVAYLFAHDAGGFGAAGTDSVVSCGSFTTDGSGSVAEVNLGWEPQFILYKSSNSTYSWAITDNMRGFPVTGGLNRLVANGSNAEQSGVNELFPTATGFKSYSGGAFAAGVTFIYLAIRRGPMKTPTDATKVFKPITSSGAAGTTQTTDFPVDTQIAAKRAGDTLNSTFNDRLRGVSTTSTGSGVYLTSSATNAEATASATTQAWDNTGFKNPTYYGGASSIYWNFRRAPSFFDVVCYTGTGSARTVSHNLGVAPEMIIVKARSGADSWQVYSSSLGATKSVFLNVTNASTTTTSGTSFNNWNSTSPSASVFTLGDNTSSTNLSPITYIAYLFASCPGVSKVGSYTGSGTTKQIDCGFTNGARFVLIKRTDSTGDWLVADTARGLVSGNDPLLKLNSTAAEVTTLDWIDPYSAGFEVVQESTANANVSGASYIYLAVA